DYFSPAMFGSPDLSIGPNVIAGSYSYFSAPTGTIGVGIAGQPTTAANWYNPLRVNIQLVDADSAKWAVPSGFTPVAGLTLNIGGSSAPEFSYNGNNGSLGVSGAVEGVVRPGITSVNNTFPSPAIDNTSTSPLSPSGYIFYDDNADNCVLPLDGSPVDLGGPAQIWPKVPVIGNFNPYLANTLQKTLRIYYQVLNPVKFSSSYPGDQALTSFAYHPITETDSSAFDDITLDAGAYEFIDNNMGINLKKNLAPYFGEEGVKSSPQSEEKKKKIFGIF
ncbi:MAG: hypothetical protein WCY34_04600, partial [Candidatus Omnitrophota bacterium]